MPKMQVWWIPQIPGEPFVVPVKTLEEANLLLDTLAAYDAFQFENRIKPDYSSIGGLRVWDENCDGEGNPGWSDWYDEASGDDFDTWREDHIGARYIDIIEATKKN